MAKYFSLRGQRKVFKRKAARLPLYPCAPPFYRGLPKGTPCPFGNAQHPCRTPDGLFPLKAPVLGAANGNGVFSL